VALRSGSHKPLTSIPIIWDAPVACFTSLCPGFPLAESRRQFDRGIIVGTWVSSDIHYWHFNGQPLECKPNSAAYWTRGRDVTIANSSYCVSYSLVTIPTVKGAIFYYLSWVSSPSSPASSCTSCFGDHGADRCKQNFYGLCDGRSPY
jgi:hypothetical protein